MANLKSRRLIKKVISMFIVFLMAMIQVPTEVFAKNNAYNNEYPLRITVSDGGNVANDVNDITPLYKDNVYGKFQNIVYTNFFPTEMHYHDSMSKVMNKFVDFNKNNSSKNDLNDYMVTHGKNAVVNFESQYSGQEIEEIEYQIYKGYHYPDNTWASWGYWKNGGFHHYINYTNAPQHTIFWEIVSPNSMNSWSRKINTYNNNKITINLPQEKGKYQMVFKIKYRNSNEKKCGVIGIFDNTGQVSVAPEPVPRPSVKAGVNLTQNTSKTTYKVNEEFNVNYKIKPNDIAKENIDNLYSKNKEVVVVVDTSGSMAWDLYGNVNSWYSDSRLNIVKEACKRFIDDLSSKSNIKVGLVEYNSKAYEKNELTNKYSDLKSQIVGFSANGGTNLGDGLRQAYYMLKNSFNRDSEKYIVLLTDGNPTFYSFRENTRYEYILDDSKNYSVNNSNDYYRGLEYAKEVANFIKDNNSDINTYMIAFTKDVDSNKLDEIAENKKNFYVKGANEVEDIDEVYNKIADTIKADVVLKNLDFQLNVPNGLEVADLPEGLKVEKDSYGQKIVGRLENINYTLSSGRYVSDEVSIDIKLKGSKSGQYNFKNSANLKYIDIDASENTKVFSGFENITLEELESSVDLKQTVGKEYYNINEPFDINYTITPKPIDKSKYESSYTKDKELVVVVDTSGSMSFDLEGYYNQIDYNGRAYRDGYEPYYGDYYKDYKPNNIKSRLDIVKGAYKRFIDELQKQRNINIGLVEFGSKAEKRIDLNNSYNDIKNGVDSFRAYGGTNIGDGLRQAYYMLKNSANSSSKKYIVLLTDGEPTSYSFKNYMYNGNSNYFKYYLDNGNDYNANSSNDYSRGLEYANEVAKFIKDSGTDINTYMIAFTKDANSNKLNEIAKDKEKFYVKEAVKEEDIDEVYSKIADVVKSDFALEALDFEFNIPNGLEVVEIPKGFRVENSENGKKLVGRLDNVIYRLEGNNYIADPVNFKIKLKGINPGEYTLKDTAKLAYTNVDKLRDKRSFTGAEKITIRKLEDKISVIKQGLVTSDSGEQFIHCDSDGSVKLIDSMKTQLGTLFRVDEGTDFNLNLSININHTDINKYNQNGGNTIKVNGAYLYKVKDDNTIEKVHSSKYKVTINNEGIASQVTMVTKGLEKNAKYILAYDIIPKVNLKSQQEIQISNKFSCGNQAIENELRICIKPLLKLE